MMSRTGRPRRGSRFADSRIQSRMVVTQPNKQGMTCMSSRCSSTESSRSRLSSLCNYTSRPSPLASYPRDMLGRPSSHSPIQTEWYPQRMPGMHCTCNHWSSTGTSRTQGMRRTRNHCCRESSRPRMPRRPCSYSPSQTERCQLHMQGTRCRCSHWSSTGTSHTRGKLCSHSPSQTARYQPHMQRTHCTCSHWSSTETNRTRGMQCTYNHYRKRSFR